MSHRRKGSGHQHRADADPPTDLLVADTAGRGESCSLPKEGRDLETILALSLVERCAMAEMVDLSAELNEGSTSGSTGMFMPGVYTARDSGISVSRFNRFIVGEIARKTGDDGRTMQDSLRKQREHAAETHREYGSSLGAASRAQMQRDKQKYDALREANLLKGLQVREDVSSQKGEAARLRQEWAEYGRRLAQQDGEQRRRIREVCGEGSKRVQDRVAQCKFEEEEYQKEMERRRAEILREKKEEVQRVREETNEAVIKESKQFAIDRRKNQALGTKDTVASWKSERSSNTATHLKSARANRADAEASRQKAKKLREELVLRRQQEAREAREASKKNQQRKDQLTIQQGLGMKTVHDGIYKAKYVPQSSAEYLESSKYGKTTV